MNTIKISEVAKIAYQANKAYSEIFDTRIRRDWTKLDQSERDFYIKGALFHLNNPDANESDSHNAWVKDMILKGWSYDKYYNPAKKTHPCIINFNKLTLEQQFKDYMFKGLINLFINRFKLNIAK